MRYKKIAKYFGFISGTLLILFFLTSFLVYQILLIPGIQDRVLRLLEDHINSLITGNVKIGRIETNFLTSIKIIGIEFSDASGRNDSITVGNIIARFRMNELLFKRFHITQLAVKDINADLSVTPQGELKIPILPDISFNDSVGFENSNELSDWDIIIDRAIVSNINAVYKDSSLDFEAKIINTSGTLKIPGLDSMVISLGVPDASFRSKWWTGTLDTIGSSAVLDFNGITLINSLIKGSGTMVRGGGRIAFSKSGLWNLAADVITDMKPVYAIHEPLKKVKPQGLLKGYGSIGGTLLKPELFFNGSGFNIQYDSYKADSLKVRGRYRRDENLEFSTNIYSSLMNFNLKGDVKIPDLFSNPSIGNYKGDFKFEKISIPVIRKILELPYKIPGTQINTEGYVSGTGINKLPEKVLATGDVNGIDSFRETPLVFEVDYFRKELKIKSIFGDNKVNGAATVSSEGDLCGTVKGSLRDVSLLNNIYNTERIKGVLTTDVKLSGNIRKPQINCSLFSDSLTWRSSAIQFLDASLQYSNDSLYICHADIFIDGKLDSAFSFFNIDSAGGNMLIEASATGNVTKPNISVNFSGSEFYYKNLKFDSLSANTTISSFDSVCWDNLRLFRDGTTITGYGFFGLKNREWKNVFGIVSNDNDLIDDGKITMNGYLRNESIRSDLSIEGMEVSALSPWAGFLKEFKGRLSANALMEGSLDSIDGKIKLKLFNEQFNDTQLAVFDNSFSLVDSLLISNSVLKIQGCRKPVKIDLKIPLTVTKKFKSGNSGNQTGYGVLKVERLDLSAIAMLMGKNWSAKGLTDIDIHVKNVKNKWKLGGFLKIHEGYVSYKPQRVKAESINLSVNLSGTVSEPEALYSLSAMETDIFKAKIDSLFLSGSLSPEMIKLKTAQFFFPHNGLFKFDGKLPILRNGSISNEQGLVLNFEIVRFPAILLSVFFPEKVIRNGMLKGQGKLWFKDGKPYADGQINLSNGKFFIQDFKPMIGPVDVKTILKGDTVFISDLNGKWGKGLFKAEGKLFWDFNGLKKINMDFKTRSLPFEITNMAFVDIQSGKLNVCGSGGRYLISGLVNLDDTRFIRDIRIMDFIDQIKKGEMIQKTSNDYLKNIGLQIKINLLDNINVDMNLGYMKLDGSVNMTGNLFEPGFTGEIELSEGYVYYFDREFQVSKAKIYNYDSFSLNPVIDLEASSEVITIGNGINDELETVSYIINLSVNGNLENPQIRLWSDDSDLNEADIISILTLGQPLGSIGGDLGERLRAFAGQSLLGFGTRKLEQILGMEKIDIRGDVFKFRSQENSPRLMLTKKINSRLMLSYETALGDLTKPKVSALLRLSRRIFLEGETDTENSGVDLKFKFSR